MRETGDRDQLEEMPPTSFGVEVITCVREGTMLYGASGGLTQNGWVPFN